jgi:hypothetical protein
MLRTEGSLNFKIGKNAEPKIITQSKNCGTMVTILLSCVNMKEALLVGHLS